MSLVTLANEPSFYPLDARVKVLSLDVATKRKGIWNRIATATKRVTVLRTAIQQTSADVVISFQTMTNLATLLATHGTNLPVIVAERIDPFVFGNSFAIRVIRNALYRRSERIVIQCARYLEALPAYLHARCVAISNPVLPPGTLEGSPPVSLNQPFMAAVGRLTHQKGFDLLLSAFEQVHQHYPNWSLMILGEGPMRSALERRIAEAGLKNFVSLPGVVTNVASALCKASLFVFPSRYEGFPNALAEAMALGLPVIASDCRCGPRELVREGFDGVLIPVGDVNSLRDAILELIKDPARRQMLGFHARTVVERFNAASIFADWDLLLQQCHRPSSDKSAVSRRRTA